MNSLLVSMVLAASMFTGSVLADEHRGPGEQMHSHVDARHGHNHSYVDRGVVVHQLPRAAVVARLGAERYWFHGGVWYHPSGRGFVVVAPPIGIFVPVLPSFCLTLTFGGIPYYYANDTYYIWRGNQQGYEVVPPPSGADSSTPPTAPDASAPGGGAVGGDSAFIYPGNGQNADQQGKDRYECHRWAEQQTGFDPTQPNGNVEPSTTDTKRADYTRAINACLEGRGYTVR